MGKSCSNRPHLVSLSYNRVCRRVYGICGGRFIQIHLNFASDSNSGRLKLTPDCIKTENSQINSQNVTIFQIYDKTKLKRKFSGNVYVFSGGVKFLFWKNRAEKYLFCCVFNYKLICVSINICSLERL